MLLFVEDFIVVFNCFKCWVYLIKLLEFRFLKREKEKEKFYKDCYY